MEQDTAKLGFIALEGGVQDDDAAAEKAAGMNGVASAWAGQQLTAIGAQVRAELDFDWRPFERRQSGERACEELT